MKTTHAKLIGWTVAAVLGAGIVFGGSVYDKTYFYNDVHMGSWKAISNITWALTNGGTYTTGTVVTNVYRLSGTNTRGRIPLSSNVVVSWTVTNNQDAVLLRWPRYDGVRHLVVERSTDGGVTWTQWLTIAPGATNWIDYGSNTWTAGAFTSEYSLIPDAVIDLPFEATNLNLNGLNDVDVQAPATGDVLRYSGSAWTNSRGTLLPGYIVATDAQARVATIETDRLSLAEGGTVSGPVTAEWAEVRQLRVGKYGSDDGRIGIHCTYAPDAIAWLRADYLGGRPRLYYSPFGNTWHELLSELDYPTGEFVRITQLAQYEIGDNVEKWRMWIDAVNVELSNKAEAVSYATNTMETLVDATNGWTAQWTWGVRTVVRNTNCWISSTGLTAVSVWNDVGYNERAGTLITPKHMVGAWHYPLTTGAMVTFLGPTNQEINRYVVDMTNFGTDLALYRLDSEVPDYITPAFLPGTTWTSREASGQGFVGVDMNRLKQIGMIRYNAYWDIRTNSALSFTAIGGDSGHPVGWITPDNQFVLDFCHYTAVSGDVVQGLVTTIEAQITAWGDTNTLKFYEHVPEYDFNYLLDGSRALRGDLNGGGYSATNLETVAYGTNVLDVGAGTWNGASIVAGASSGAQTNEENWWTDWNHFETNITVGGNWLVTNLNAQYLNGHPSSDFATGTPLYAESDPHFSGVSNSIVYDGDAAGGDLQGTYPNPTIAAGAVGSNQINWSETTLGSVGDVVITAGVAAGQSLKYDGTNWYAGTDETGGGGGGGATNREITLLPQGSILDATNPAVISVVQSTGVGAPRFYRAAFDDDDHDGMYWDFITPSDAISGTDWTASVYWYADENTTNQVVWCLQVSATSDADVDNVEEQSAGSPVCTTVTVQTTESKALHQTDVLLPFSALDGVEAEDSLVIKLFRDGNNAGDTFTNRIYLRKLYLRIPRI